MRDRQALRELAGPAAIWAISFSPLAFVPGGFDRFLFPKIALVCAAIAMGSQRTRTSRLPRGISLLIAAVVVFFLVGIAASPTPWASAVGRWPRYEGIAVVLIYVGAFWLGARLAAPDDQPDVLTSALSWCAIMLGVTSLAEVRDWSITGPSDVSRAGGLLGNASDQGMVAMMLVACLAVPALERTGRLAGIGLLAALATVVASGSRSAMLGVAVAVVVLVVTRGRRGRPLPLVLGFGGLMLAAATLSGRLTQTATVSGRLNLWQRSASLLREHPLTGLGPSRFVDAIGSRFDIEWARTVGVANPPDSPHSLLLQVGLAGGIPLALAVAALSGAVLLRGWRAASLPTDPGMRAGLLAAVTAYGVALQANFTTAGVTCLALFLAGRLVAEEMPAPVRHRRLERLVTAAACLGLLWSASAAVSEVTLRRGIDAAAAGEVTDARRMFSATQRLRPMDADVCMLAAQSLALPASSGDRAAAEETLRWARCSRLRTPDTLASGLAAGVALDTLGRPQEAAVELDRLARLFPAEPSVFIQRAVTSAQLGDTPAALQDLARAHVLDPNDPRVTQLRTAILAGAS